MDKILGKLNIQEYLIKHEEFVIFSDKRYTIFLIKSENHNLPLISGKGQIAGREYAADLFETDEKNKTARVSYGQAYENRDKIKTLERK